MDSWQSLSWRSFMTLIRCFSCADPVVSNLWWFKSSREIVMSLKTTRGVTWENQILWIVITGSLWGPLSLVGYRADHWSLQWALMSDKKRQTSWNLRMKCCQSSLTPCLLSLSCGHLSLWSELSGFLVPLLVPVFALLLTRHQSAYPAHWGRERRQTLVTRASSGPVQWPGAS